MKKIFLSLTLLTSIVAPAMAALDLTDKATVDAAFEKLQQENSSRIFKSGTNYYFGYMHDDNRPRKYNRCASHDRVSEDDKHCYSCRIHRAYTYLAQVQRMHSVPNGLAQLNTFLEKNYTYEQLLDAQTRAAAWETFIEKDSGNYGGWGSSNSFTRKDTWTTGYSRSESKKPNDRDIQAAFDYLDGLERACNANDLAVLNAVTGQEYNIGTVTAQAETLLPVYTQKQRDAARTTLRRLAWGAQDHCPSHHSLTTPDTSCNICIHVYGAYILKKIVDRQDGRIRPMTPEEKRLIDQLLDGSHPQVQQLPEAAPYEQLFEKYRFIKDHEECEHQEHPSRCTEQNCVGHALHIRYTAIEKKLQNLYKKETVDPLTPEEEQLLAAMVNGTDPHKIPQKMSQLFSLQQVIDEEESELSRELATLNPDAFATRQQEITALETRSNALFHAFVLEYHAYLTQHGAQLSAIAPLDPKEEKIVTTALTRTDPVIENALKQQPQLTQQLNNLSGNTQSAGNYTMAAQGATALGTAATIYALYAAYTTAYKKIEQKNKENNVTMTAEELRSAALKKAWKTPLRKRKLLIAGLALATLGGAVWFSGK